MRHKVLKNKTGSLRVPNSCHQHFEKKNLGHLIKIMSQEPRVMGGIYYFTKMFLNKFEEKSRSFRLKQDLQKLPKKHTNKTYQVGHNS